MPTPLASLMRLLPGLTGGLLLGLWLIGRVATDRTVATQYLSWTPPEALLGLASVAWCLQLVVLARARRRRPADSSGRERRRARRRTRLAQSGLALTVLAVAWTGLVDWHLWRLGPRLWQTPPSPALRVMHWNMNGQHPAVWPELILKIPAPTLDIICLTNVHRGSAARFAMLPATLGDGFEIERRAHLAIASRVEILEAAGASLHLPRPESYPTTSTSRVVAPIAPLVTPPRLPTEPGWYDPGFVMYARLDTTAQLGRPLVVWLIDLPSDVMIPRGAMTDLVLGRLAEVEAGGWPAPDLLVGDFNIPRGSHALRRIARGLTHAHAQSGAGRNATWPSELPLLHIDHAFVAPWLRTTRYTIGGPDGSPHLAQRFGLLAR